MAVRRDITKLSKSFDDFVRDFKLKAAPGLCTPQKRRERIRTVHGDPLAFAKTYYPDIFSQPYSEVHQHIAALEPGRHLVTGFPLSGKSALAYVGLAIRKVAYGTGGIIAVALRTEEDAHNRTSALSRLMLSNEVLCYDFEIEAVQDKAGYHIFKSRHGTTTLIGVSVRQGLRAKVDDRFKRFRLVIGDDLWNRVSVRSEIDSPYVREFIEAELWRQCEPDATMLILGNMVSHNCPGMLLKETGRFNHFSFPIRDPETGISNWPEVWPEERIDEQEADTDPDVWIGEWCDEPYEHGEIFEDDWFQFREPSRSKAAIMVIDPSFGKSPAACFKGIMTVQYSTDHITDVLDVYLRKESYAHAFDYVAATLERFPQITAVLFEDDFAQFSIAAPYYNEWCERTGKTLPLVTFRAKDLKDENIPADKQSRIWRLVHPHQQKKIYYNTSLRHSPDFERHKRQQLSFGQAKTKSKRKKLDGPDALATGFIMVRRYTQTGHFKSLKKRKLARPRRVRGRVLG